MRQLAVITRIHDLVQENSQFIIATHSPIIMAYRHALIYAFSRKGVNRVAYEDTEHYRITRDFLLKMRAVVTTNNHAATYGMWNEALSVYWERPVPLEGKHAR